MKSKRENNEKLKKVIKKIFSTKKNSINTKNSTDNKHLNSLFLNNYKNELKDNLITSNDKPIKKNTNKSDDYHESLVRKIKNNINNLDKLSDSKQKKTININNRTNKTSKDLDLSCEDFIEKINSPDKEYNNNITSSTNINIPKKLFNVDFVNYFPEKEKNKINGILNGDNVIINNIDNIYFNISDNKKYFNNVAPNILILVLLISLFSFFIVFIPVKPSFYTSYCFNRSSFEFESCSMKDVCSYTSNNIDTKSINKLLYISRDKVLDYLVYLPVTELFNLYNYLDKIDEYNNFTKTKKPITKAYLAESLVNFADSTIERLVINIIFQKFTKKDIIIYLSLLKEQNDTSIYTMDIYSFNLVLYNESYLSYNMLTNNYCSVDFEFELDSINSQKYLVSYLFSTISILLGILINSLVSDVKGRKKLIKLGLLIMILSLLGFSLLTVFINIKKDSNNKLISSYIEYFNMIKINNNNNNNNNCQEKNNAINSLKIYDIFVSDKSTELMYNLMFHKVGKETLTIQFLYSLTNKCFIFIVIIKFSMILGFIFTVINTVLLLLELSLNDIKLHGNLYRMYICCLFSFMLYQLIPVINVFYLYILILTIFIQIVLFVLTYFYIIESPRYLYENGNYEKLTFDLYKIFYNEDNYSSIKLLIALIKKALTFKKNIQIFNTNMNNNDSEKELAKIKDIEKLDLLLIDKSYVSLKSEFLYNKYIKWRFFGKIYSFKKIRYTKNFLDIKKDEDETIKKSFNKSMTSLEKNLSNTKVNNINASKNTINNNISKVKFYSSDKSNTRDKYHSFRHTKKSKISLNYNLNYKKLINKLAHKKSNLKNILPLNNLLINNVHKDKYNAYINEKNLILNNNNIKSFNTIEEYSSKHNIKESVNKLIKFSTAEEIDIDKDNINFDMRYSIIADSPKKTCKKKRFTNKKNSMKFASFLNNDIIVTKDLYDNNTEKRILFLNPLNLIFFIKGSKRIRGEFLLLISYTIIISFNFTAIMSNINLDGLITRHHIYNNTLLKYLKLFLVIVIFFSIRIFSFLYQYFGLKIINKVCFIMNFIIYILTAYILNDNSNKKTFSIIDDKAIKNNEVFYIDDDINNSFNMTFYIILIFFNYFFSTGPFIVLIPHIIRFTKTIYRGMFISFFTLCFVGGCLFSYLLLIFYHSYLRFVIASLISLFGLLIGIFLWEDIEEHIINDWREMKL